MRDGRYAFDPSKLGEAHAACRAKFEAALKDDSVQYIVVDNTNIQLEHVMQYVDRARGHADIIVESLITKDAEAVALCFKRNPHGVPRAVVVGQAVSFQPLPPERALHAARD